MFHVEHIFKLKKYFMNVSGKIVDVYNREIFPAVISFNRGRIQEISRVDSAPDMFILPGLIDAHVHVESSMVTPGAFAMTAVRHGTTGVVSDPHEIANVLGIAGINFMIADGEKVPLKFWFGAPSCVPATSFETNGAVIDHDGIKNLFQNKKIRFLAEMMNYPGVIYRDPEVLKKLEIARKYSRIIDGHAPGLRGEKLKKYIGEGISTDHECSNIDEAKEKISLGMKILIREGSAARNIEALQDLVRTDPNMIMLCSDDIHPEMLLKGHINKLILYLVNRGHDIFNVIRCATVNPAKHYGLEAGLLQPGQAADFILVDTLNNMNVIETWIDGIKVFDRKSVLFNYNSDIKMNNFNCTEISQEDIKTVRKSDKMRIIEVKDGELTTKKLIVKTSKENNIVADEKKDFLKIVVKDRYLDSPPAVGFIKGFGLKQGAFASSVSHDSHNIVCVGASDEEIVTAINAVIKLRGGLAVVNKKKLNKLHLNIAGIMSTRSVGEVADDYERLSGMVKKMGCTLQAPFMTLSFMALLVIPELKICDKGLFDVKAFKLVPLFV
jgi:adenine deaminase